ncbi:MAG: PKD domain-containing protein [Bacteroidota bacterium]
MKSILRLLIIIPFLAASQYSYSQWIDQVLVNPTAPVDCSSFTVTANCTFACANSILNGSSYTVAGSDIFVDIDVTQPLICLPALFQFSISEVIQAPSGSYTLTVRYFQNGSVVTSSAQPITIASCCPADPSFSSNITGNICEGDSMTFTAAVDTLTTYEWKIDGSTFSALPVYTHTFSSEGIYDVRLIVFDGSCYDSTSMTINTGGYPELTVDSLIDESCPGAFDGLIELTTGGGISPYTYVWQNGLTMEDQNVGGAGLNWVEVTDNFGCVTIDTFTLGVGNGVTAAFTLKGEELSCIGDSIGFINGTNASATYQWLANGQVFSTMEDASYFYDSAGVYTISLVAIEGACRDTVTRTVQASSPGSLSSVITSPNCPGIDDGMIDLTLTGGFAPFSYGWSDGQRSEDAIDLGPGMITISIFDSAGCAILDTFELDVLGGLEAGFSVTRPNETVNFKDESDASAVSWLWDFGDGNTSTDQNPSHVYDSSATFTVCLIATDNFGCQDTTCQELSYTVNLEEMDPFGIRLYPNPTSGMVFIEGESLIGTAVITVLDMQGREMIREKHKELSGSLDLGRLAAGVYLLRIETNGQLGTYVIQKN